MSRRDPPPLTWEDLLRRANAPAAPSGVMWCGPGASDWVFFSAHEWNERSAALVSAGPRSDVAANLALAELNGGHVFCEAVPSCLHAIPLFGAIFGEPIRTWVSAPLRRSERLRKRALGD